MRNELAIVFLLIFISTQVFADVYVVTAADKSVYSISEADDAVVPEGYKKDVLKDKEIKDLGLDSVISLYDFNGSKFALNPKKVSDRNKAQEEALLEAERDKKTIASLVEKLKGLGLNEDEISVILN